MLLTTVGLSRASSCVSNISFENYHLRRAILQLNQHLIINEQMSTYCTELQDFLFNMDRKLFINDKLCYRYIMESHYRITFRKICKLFIKGQEQIERNRIKCQYEDYKFFSTPFVKYIERQERMKMYNDFYFEGRDIIRLEKAANYSRLMIDFYSYIEDIPYESSIASDDEEDNDGDGMSIELSSNA